MTTYLLVKNGEVLKTSQIAPNVDQSTLALGKPRWLPLVVENEAFNPQTQVRTGPERVFEIDRVVDRYTVRDKNVGEVAELKAQAIRSVRREEVRRIGLAMSDGEQTALLVLGLMGLIGQQSFNRATWPAALRNAFNPLYTTATTTVRAIHEAAVTKIGQVNALSTASELAGYDITTGWPN